MREPKSGPVQFVVSADGSRIAYETTGSGPLMVCIFGAICHRKFFPVRRDVQELAKEFTVVNYDRRGRGESNENSTWSLAREIEDIAALLEAHGGKAILYGHSSGAVIALEAALMLNERVEKVVLYDPSYVSNPSDKKEFLTLKAEVEHLLSIGKRSQALKTFLAGIGMPALFVALLPFFPGWTTMKKMAHTIMYDISVTEDLVPVDRLQYIRRPTLLLAGGKSPQSIQEVFRTLAQTIPQCESSLVADQDHMVSMNAILPQMTKFCGVLTC